MKNKLIILIGGSGTGKTTTEKYIVNKGLAEPVISHTSRAIREVEKDGVDYHFVSTKEILEMGKANHIIITDDWHYAVSPKYFEMNKDLVYSVINVQPAIDLMNFAKQKDFEVIVIFFNVSKEIRLKKMIERGESKEAVEIRLSREDTIESCIEKGLIPNYVENIMDEDMQERVVGKIWKQK